MPSLLRSPFPAAPLCFACFAASFRGRAACSASLLRACRRFRAACFCRAAPPPASPPAFAAFAAVLPAAVLFPCRRPACRVLPSASPAASVLPPLLRSPACLRFCRACSLPLPSLLACSPAACLLLCCLPFCSCRAACLCPLCVSAILQRRAACLLCRFFCLLPRFCAAFGIFVPSRRFACFIGLFSAPLPAVPAPPLLCLPCLPPLEACRLLRCCAAFPCLLLLLSLCA